MVSILVKSKQYGGMWAYFDDEDYKKVNGLAYYIYKSKNSYYLKFATKINGQRKVVFVHRFIFNFPPLEKVIDHIDGNGLNNRRNNLRFASNVENSRNCKIQSNNTTGFKGVHLERKTGKYYAVIVVNRKYVTGGEMFDSPVRAAQKYNELATEHFKDFARLNTFTPEQQAELSLPYVKSSRRGRSKNKIQK